jgi:hypothetical protein
MPMRRFQTMGTVATAGVAYTALVDQHMVPLGGMKGRMPNLLPWDDLLLVRHFGRPNDVALLLSSEYPPSTTSCLFPTLQETLDASPLAGSSKRSPDMCTYLVEDQKLAWP